MTPVIIRDVALLAGVSIETVSQVLNGSTAVRETTRKTVLAVIEEAGYLSHLTTPRFISDKTMTIGIIGPLFADPSSVKRLRGVVSVLAETEYDMILLNVETVAQQTKYFEEILSQNRLDGLLIMSIVPSDTDVAQLAEAGITSVLIDAYHPQLTHVIIDNFAGGYQATSHLIDLGHRKIGYVSAYLESQMGHCLSGCQQAMADAGIAFRPEYYLEGTNGRVEAQRIIHELLSLSDPPTAIFAFSGTQAMAILQAARDLERTVPDKLSVIGFDDIEAAEYLQLTTIHQPLFTSGVVATKWLLAQIRQEAESPEEILLPTQLIIRNTTGRLQE